MENKRYTKGDYKKLGDRIRKSPDNISQSDYEMLQYLRMSYKDPLAIVFRSIYYLAIRINSDCVCTYRIKRIESIISKVLRFKDMQIHRAADIAGCRCIMPRIDDVHKLYKRIKSSEDSLPFTIKGVNDYIENPKDNGYRSLHLNVETKEEPKRVIEIQIRDIEQHNWATLVETSDVLYDSKLKEFGAEKTPDLYEFHQILSKNDGEFTMKDKKRISNISGKYRYLETVGSVFVKNNLKLREQRNNLKMKNLSFFLISTNKNGDPELKAYDNFNDAESEYFEMFSNNPDQKNIVLAHLNNTTYNKLSIAYSNYFLTYNETLIRILKVIADVTIYSYNNFNVFSFKKNYKAFHHITCIWFADKMTETESYIKNKNIQHSIKKKREWAASINANLFNVLSIAKHMNDGFDTDILHFIMIWYRNRQDKQIKILPIFRTNFS